jgi:hypothetical protein
MNTVTATAALPPQVAAWCADYAGFALFLAEAFLVLALVVAVVETGIALWAKFVATRPGPVADRMAANAALPPVDPIKLIEALKALLETLKGLPAWIAIFLAGLALLWMAGQTPDICTPPGPSQASQPRAPANSGRQTGSAGNTQAAAQSNATR